MIETDSPVKKSEDFFGRKSIIRRIFSRIGAERPQSIAVIGGRKSGKTSLLYSLLNPAVQENYLENPDNYLFHIIDSNDSSYSDADSYIRQILEFIHDDSVEGENQYNILQRIVKEIHVNGKKLILLLDDFHFVTQNEQFPLEFFSFLRSLANNYNVAYVTTSFLELQKLCIAKDIEESPFFNIFTNLSIGPLSLSEGIQLFTHFSGFSEKTSEKIVTWCGPVPYLLKILSQAFKNNAGLKNIDENNFENKLMDFINEYFNLIISILSKDALNSLKQIAKGKQPDPREVHLLRPLIRHGFLVEDEEKIFPFSKAFLSYMKKNLSSKLLMGQEHYSKI